MTQKTIAGISVEVSDEGYLINASDWTKEMAIEMAKEDGIVLTEAHFKVLNYLRDAIEKGESLSIRKVGKSGIVDIKGLYKLFPGGPLKLSSKYAGIHKPTSCV